MRKLGLMILLLAVGVGIGLLVSNRKTPAEAEPKPGAGFAAIPGTLGSEDLTGPYQVVKGWPKDISTLPGNGSWTYGAGESVFAESPNRIYMLFRGELPKMAPPKAVLLPQVGPSLSFPVAGFWRDATMASLPGTGGTDDNTAEWLTAWEGKAPDLGIKGPPYRKLGVDAKWENCLVVVDGDGNIIETWKQWDKLFRRPHSVYISPYDPDKNVWVVDDNMQVIYRVYPRRQTTLADHRNAGSTRARTPPTSTGRRISIGCRTALSSFRMGIPGRAWRSSIRTASSSCSGESKADRARGGDKTPPDERPGYFSNVHGIAVDPKTHHVFVNDRNNHRIQVFDENGKFQYQWKVDADPSSLHLALHRIGQHDLDVRPHHQQDGRVGPARASSVRLGSHGRCSREASGACMGLAWIRMATCMRRGR